MVHTFAPREGPIGPAPWTTAADIARYRAAEGAVRTLGAVATLDAELGSDTFARNVLTSLRKVATDESRNTTLRLEAFKAITAIEGVLEAL